MCYASATTQLSDMHNLIFLSICFTSSRLSVSLCASLSISSHTPVTRSTQHCILSGSVTKSSVNLGENVTSAGWQVTLCDPIRHVSSRRGLATLRTAIHLRYCTLLTSSSFADSPLCSSTTPSFFHSQLKSTIYRSPSHLRLPFLLRTDCNCPLLKKTTAWTVQAC